MRIIKFGLAALLVVVVGLGLSHISFNVDILKLLPGNLKQVQGLALFLKNFSSPDELMITVESADAAADASSLADALRQHSDLARRVVDQPPWENPSADLAALTAYLLLNQPPADLAALAEQLTPAQAPQTLQATREALGTSLSPAEVAARSYDPYGLGLSLTAALPSDTQSEFSSADGKFHVIYVDAARPLANYQDAIAWIARVRAVATAWNTSHQATLGFTGEPAFMADISATMQWDMMSSAFVTLFVIAVIFWICFRRLRPLADLLLMLVLIFVISLGLAGIFLKELTAIGVGFASIMIGLSVDYGYLIYQKSLGHQGTLRELQWNCLQNIMWTAGTTAAAFFALNLGSLPGLAQLGNLVGLGVLVGATVMLLVFAPITLGWKKAPPPPSFVQRLFASARFHRGGAIFTASLVVLLLAGLVLHGLPDFDSSSRPLRPRHSEAYAAMDRLSTKLTNRDAALSLIVSGTDEKQVAARLEIAQQNLQSAQARGDVLSFTSPLPLWPSPAHQSANLPLLQKLAADAPRLKQTLLDQGFTADAFTFAGSVLDQATTWTSNKLPLWPHGESADWILRRTASHANGQFVALGLVTPAPGREDALTAAVQTDGVYLVSWSQLGRELHQVIPREFIFLILSLLAIVTVILLFGLRSVVDVSLLLLTVALVFLSLAGAMRWLGQEWNLFNLAAVLLLLGTGIDYSILLLIALRKNGGDVLDAQRTIGLVVALCATSAAAGFGTIGWANHRGLASLGLTCSLGLVLDILISLFLLPLLWRVCHRRRS